MNAAALQEIANARRADVLTMIARGKAGHIGGAMSVLDILTALYYDVMNVSPSEVNHPLRDRFLLSKGHSVEGYLAILADLDFIKKSDLRTFSQEGSNLIGHPNNSIAGVEVCTGALGHGLPIGVGMALAAKRTAKPYRTFVVMGDGEQDEGSVWEAAMAGANYHLDNLFAIVDRNGLQISGTTEQVMGLENFRSKWEAFGWEVSEVDGHDMQALLDYFHGAKAEGKPHCLIAHTTKGKGLPFAQNQLEWHHKVPTAQQLEEGYKALGVKGVEWA
ncbi:MAG: transketolase [Clostridiales bacterium]|nr:transketolase [Clostridiales bacterium]